ncbi:MAG: hypothetical protein JJU36_00595 [Phycisphaeraceae bacterium]|nr:hypothetical protein [Phycisphaeraceae bacterium]
MSRTLGFLLLIAAPIGYPSAARAGGDSHHEEARRTVEEILAQRRFRGLDPTRGDPWYAAWLRSAWEAIQGFIESLPVWLLWVLVIWMVLALLAIFIHLLWTIGAFRWLGRKNSGEPETGLEAVGETLLDEEMLLKQADQQLQRGDFTGASRALLLTLLLRLARGRWIRFDRDVTNGQALRQVPTDFPLRDSLAPAVRRMDAVTYGGLSADESLCRTLRSLVERIPVDPNPQ